MCLLLILFYSPCSNGFKATKYILTESNSARLIENHTEFKTLIECGSFCLSVENTCQGFLFENTGEGYCKVYDLNGEQSLKLYVSEAVLEEMKVGPPSIEFQKSSNKILLIGGPSILDRSDYFEYTVRYANYFPSLFENYDINNANPSINGMVMNLDSVQNPCAYYWKPLDYQHENGAGFGLLENRYPIFCGGAPLDETKMNCKSRLYYKNKS